MNATDTKKTYGWLVKWTTYGNWTHKNESKDFDRESTARWYVEKLRTTDDVYDIKLIRVIMEEFEV